MSVVLICTIAFYFDLAQASPEPAGEPPRRSLCPLSPPCLKTSKHSPGFAERLEPSSIAPESFLQPVLLRTPPSSPEQPLSPPRLYLRRIHHHRAGERSPSLSPIFAPCSSFYRATAIARHRLLRRWVARSEEDDYSPGAEQVSRRILIRWLFEVVQTERVSTLRSRLDGQDQLAVNSDQSVPRVMR